MRRNYKCGVSSVLMLLLASCGPTQPPSSPQSAAPVTQAPQPTPPKPTTYQVNGVLYTSRDDAFKAQTDSDDIVLAKITKMSPRIGGKLLVVRSTDEQMRRVVRTANQPNQPIAPDGVIILAREVNLRAGLAALDKAALFDSMDTQVSDTPQAVAADQYDYVLTAQFSNASPAPTWMLMRAKDRGKMAYLRVPGINDRGQALQNYLTAMVNAAADLGVDIPRQQMGLVHGLFSGTVFFINAAGNGVTNAHVVNGCQSMKVVLPSGEVDASLQQMDTANDLAVIKVPSRQGALAKFRAAPPVRLGEDVVVFGYPLSGGLGQGLLSSQGNLTTGTISALSGTKDDSRMLQISAPVQPGNSGGALVDQSGHVIGVVNSGLNALAVASVTGSLSQNANFAVKSQIVTNFLDTIGVAYETDASKAKMSTADIADKLKSFSALLKCQK